MKVVASGYFDPIHSGHINYLREAKKLAGAKGELIVILNNDKQAVLKKGSFFMPVKERKVILESIKYVDRLARKLVIHPSMKQSSSKIIKNYLAKHKCKCGGNNLI